MTPVSTSHQTVPRIVLSIDIGVKNLAYCLLSAKDTYEDGNNYTIYEWDSINLLDDEEYPSCQAELKSGARKGECCGKQSNIKVHTKFGDGDETSEYYCSTHNPDKAKYIAKEETKVRSVLLKDKCMALYNALDSRPQLLSRPVEVVIEQQMKKNPTMIQMAHLVYSYFLMKGYINEESPIKNVAFVSASKKLQVYDGPVLDCKLKNAYSQRKWYACEYTKWMIRNDPQHHSYLTQFPKKKDDLSDCFLQGVWWLTNKGPNGFNRTGGPNGTNGTNGFVNRGKPKKKVRKVRKNINIKSSKQK